MVIPHFPGWHSLGCIPQFPGWHGFIPPESPGGWSWLYRSRIPVVGQWSWLYPPISRLAWLYHPPESPGGWSYPSISRMAWFYPSRIPGWLVMVVSLQNHSSWSVVMVVFPNFQVVSSPRIPGWLVMVVSPKSTGGMVVFLQNLRVAGCILPFSEVVIYII